MNWLSTNLRCTHTYVDAMNAIEGLGISKETIEVKITMDNMPQLICCITQLLVGSLSSCKGGNGNRMASTLNNPLSHIPTDSYWLVKLYSAQLQAGWLLGH